VRVLLPEGDRDSALDSAIVASALAVAVSGRLLAPQAVTGSRALTLALVLSPLVLCAGVATLVRLLFLTRFRVPSAWLLSACAACALAGTLGGALQGRIAGGTGTWRDGLLLASPFLLGAAALHPSMAALTRPASRAGPGRAHGGVGAGRLAVLGASVCGATLALLARPALSREALLPAAAGGVLIVLVLVRLVRLVAEGERAGRALDARAEQQATVARLGQLALERVDLPALLDAAAAAVTAALGLPLCGVFELQPGGRTLLRTGGAGWPPDAAGPALLTLSPGGALARVLRGGERVAIGEGAPRELVDLAGWRPAVTAMVLVGTAERPLGVLTVAGRTRRAFPPSDVDFLVAVANLLGGAIARWLAESEFRHRAFHDPLSGLANRTLFRDRLDHALSTHRRSGGTVAVLFVDLDDFKTVNDSLGHQAGDRLLVAVAERISACLRPGDTAARLGGDEFAVLVEQLDGVDGAVAAAERLLAALGDPLPTVDRYVSIGASIGIACAVAGQATGDTVLRDADTAMYAAKTGGKGRYAVFEPAMHAEALHRLDLRVDLERAVERGELRLAYQPIVVLETGAVVGAEALVRWQHPLRGLLGPEEFIGVAEQTGLIVPVGRWILEQACHQARLWPRDERGGERTVSVNLSASQLVRARAVEDVRAALAASGLHPSSLLLELTESVLLADESLAALRELRGLGARLALDDFGTGYSSLDHLRRVLPDVVKVDRSFVALLGQDRAGQDQPSDHAAALARGIVRLAESLGVVTVGEGVEDARQLGELMAMGCQLGQGSLFAMPLDPDAFARFLEDGSPRELAG
jgi:diguanylate cyclase (GGDEF)-like protein